MTSLPLSTTIYYIDPLPDPNIIIDHEADVPLLSGAITWRSYGQDIPAGSTYLWTIGSGDDLTEILAGSVLQACRRDIPDASENQLLNALELLMEKLVDASAQHSRFKYRHGDAFNEYIESVAGELPATMNNQ